MDITTPEEAVWVLFCLAVQNALVMVGMFRVTAPGVPHNSFRKILALQLGTFPLVGLAAAWRWRGTPVVRRHVLRVQGWVLFLLMVELLAAWFG